MIKAVGYTRVSTDEQAVYGTGLDTQCIEIERYCFRIGAKLIGIESDPGVPGVVYPRPGLDRAIALIKSGQANTIIVHRVDRLGRKLWIPCFLLEQIQKLRGALHSVQDGEANDQNIILFALRCGIAQTDYTNLVGNMKAGKRRLAERGLAPIRTAAPYGYRIITRIVDGRLREDAGKYEVIEAEAVIVRRVFDQYAAGHSLNSIARRLNADQVPTKLQRGSMRGVWEVTTVKRMLINTAYKGFVFFNKTSVAYEDRESLPPDRRRDMRSETGRRRIYSSTAEAEQIRIEIPRIITDEQWQACSSILQANRSGFGMTIDNKRRNIYSGLLFCPLCGKSMRSGRINYKNLPPSERPISYRCARFAKSQDVAGEGCSPTHYRESAIHAAVSQAFQAIALDTRFLQEAIEAEQNQQAENPSPAPDPESIRRQINALAKKEAAAAEAYASAIEIGTPKAAFEQLLRAHAATRSDLEQQLATAIAHQKQLESGGSNLHTAQQLIQRFAEDITEVLDSETLTPVEKNSLLRRVIRKIIPGAGGSYTIHFEPFCTETTQETIPDPSLNHTNPATDSTPVTQIPELHQVHIHPAPLTGIVIQVTRERLNINLTLRNQGR